MSHLKSSHFEDFDHSLVGDRDRYQSPKVVEISRRRCHLLSGPRPVALPSVLAGLRAQAARRSLVREKKEEIVKWVYVQDACSKSNLKVGTNSELHRMDVGRIQTDFLRF